MRGACMATNKAHEQFRSHEEELLATFLRAAVEAGEFNLADPTLAARVLLRLYHSYSLHLDASAMPSPDELRTAYKLLLYGLLTRK